MRNEVCFFNRDQSPINVSEPYPGSTAFIIAGGQSFSKIDCASLRFAWTMTLNNSSSTFRGNANCVVDEPSRFSYSVWLDPTVQKFVPLEFFESPLWDNRYLTETSGNVGQRWRLADKRLRDCPNVVGYRRNDRFDASQFLHEETINWGCHAKYGGGRSVMLPALRILYLLGFRRVYLLGVDFEMSETKKYHFDEDRGKGAISCNMRTYQRLQRWFAELQPYFLKEGFVVRNCNPDSKLTIFPFTPFDEAIDEALAPLGDYRKERTRGMYSSLEDKLAESAALAGQ